MRGRLAWAKAAAIAMLIVGLFGGPATAAQHPERLQETIYNEEHQLAKAEEQKDRSYFERKLDEHLIFVAYNGLVLTKSEIVRGITYIDVSRYAIENLKVRTLGEDAALATYDLKASGSVVGHNLPAKQYASSVWVRSGGDWQLIFHQSTPAHH